MRKPGDILAILTGLLVAAGLGACMRMETVYEDGACELVMRPGPAVVKAADEYDGGPFGVYVFSSALETGSPWADAWADAGTQTYLENVAFNEVDGVWAGWDCAKGSYHPYYYPAGASVLFAGYSPHKEVSGGVIKSVSHVKDLVDVYNPYFQIEVSQSTDLGKMVDLLYFDPADAAGGTTVYGSSDPVAIGFRHAMSMVVLNLHHHYHDVSAVMHECVFDATFFSGTAPGWLPSTAKDNEGKFTGIKDVEGLFPGSDNNTQVMYLIPQYTGGHFDVMGEQIGGDITLELTVTDRIPKTETADPDDYMETSGTVLVNIKDYTPRWEIGKKYVYDITVDKPIEFGAPNVVSVETMVIEL